MQVKIINKSVNPLPKYETINSAGLDIRADLTYINSDYFNGVAIDEERDTLLIFPKGRCLIPTGLYMEIPKGYEAQIRPRSGLALREGITVLNSPGTIDADFRGEIGIILKNSGTDVVEIQTGDRICQMVIAKVEQIEWVEVNSLEKTDRGEGSFGHTGS